MFRFHMYPGSRCSYAVMLLYSLLRFPSPRTQFCCCGNKLYSTLICMVFNHKYVPFQFQLFACSYEWQQITEDKFGFGKTISAFSSRYRKVIAYYTS